MQEAGATADLELAYTLADGVEYIRAGLAAGLDIDAFAPRLSFFWAIGMNFFTEIAKMRAARLLWCELVGPFAPQIAEVARAAHALPDLGLVADGAGRVEQRGAHADRGDGGDAGGTQSLHTNALDEALALPTDETARIARNTQLFLQAESGTTRLIDPWGGSYYVERLTHDLAGRAREHMAEIDALGGMAKAIEAGVPKRRIEEAATRMQARIDAARRPWSASTATGRRAATTDAPQDRRAATCASARSQSSTACAPSATSAAAGGARRAARGRARRRPTCWRCRSRRRARAPPSARSRWRWKTCSAAMPPSPRCVRGIYCETAGDTDAIMHARAPRGGLRRERRARAAHPRLPKRGRTATTAARR